MANSMDPDQQSVLCPHFLNSPVMLGNYLQQTTSADDTFRCTFLGALRVRHYMMHQKKNKTLIFFKVILKIYMSDLW